MVDANSAAENMLFLCNMGLSSLLGLARRCFFFQAEDGIRDGTVTGVQTCALPISVRRTPRSPGTPRTSAPPASAAPAPRSEEHTSELQSQFHLVCRLLLEKKKKQIPVSPPPPDPPSQREDALTHR